MSAEEVRIEVSDRFGTTELSGKAAVGFAVRGKEVVSVATGPASPEELMHVAASAAKRSAALLVAQTGKDPVLALAFVMDRMIKAIAEGGAESIAREADSLAANNAAAEMEKAAAEEGR